MAKYGGLHKQLSQMAATGQSLEQQVQQLIDQKKYGAAIRKLQQGLKRDPNQALTISEADILLLQGKDCFESSQYSQAEKALRQALELGLHNDTYYWLAKCLLAQNQFVEALDLFQAAFDQKTLPKELGGSYLKLLVLNGRFEQVQTLIKAQAKRFHAPHLHWVRGAIALKAENFQEALAHFKKMGRPASPDDRPTLWQAYVAQAAGDWSQATKELSMVLPSLKGSLFRTQLTRHPATQRLMLVQLGHTSFAPSDFFALRQPDLPKRDLVFVLELLHLIGKENYHDAAHVWHKLPASAIATYPVLKSLHRPLMLLAGEQARQEREVSCTATFWAEALEEDPTLFDPNLALNLYEALNFDQSYSKAARLLNKLITWVKKSAQEDPQAWPTPRLNSTLAKLHCQLADCQMSLDRYGEAARSLKQAEQLAPTHPDVIGRQGLDRYAKGQKDAAIPLLTQALEEGCRFAEVYEILLEALEHDAEATKAIRRKFGKHFGDVGVETEVEVPAWVEALTFQNYGMLENTVRSQKKSSPAIKAFQIFLDAADDDPSSGQKITLNQAKAVPQWEALLANHEPAEQVEIVKAVYLIIQQHAKRNQKGIIALQSDYFAKASELASQQTPGADVLHLMLLALRAPTQLDTAVQSRLSRSPQPGNTLARAQLELQHFVHNRKLDLFIEAALKQDPQNPLLLLAKATLYDRDSRDYESFYDQGFEIARQLQNAEALQAFREEEWFSAQDLTRRALGSQIANLNDPDSLDMLDMIKRIARQAFGTDVPPEVLARMIPELMARMEDEMESEFDEFDEAEDDDDFGSFFFPPRPRRSAKRPGGRTGQTSAKKKKPWYEL